MTEAALGVRQRQREGTRDRARLVILARQRLDRLAIGGHPGRECEPDGGSRRHANPLPETDDRIEDGAHGVGKGAAVGHRQRRPEPSAATDEAGAVGLPLEAAHRVTVDRHHVGKPHVRLAGFSRPAGREQRVELGRALRLDEEVGKGRVGRVGRG